jgi:hypothetical protein
MFTPKTRPPMKLSRDEETYLRHWMHEELHYQCGPGPAKRLQFEHGVASADLAAVIAAAIPVPADQHAAALAAPRDEPPQWPWSDQTFAQRLQQARCLLAERAADGKGSVPRPGSDQTSGAIPLEKSSNA